MLKLSYVIKYNPAFEVSLDDAFGRLNSSGEATLRFESGSLCLELEDRGMARYSLDLMLPSGTRVCFFHDADGAPHSSKKGKRRREYYILTLPDNESLSVCYGQCTYRQPSVRRRTSTETIRSLA